MTITVEQLVSREVHYCASSLVSTLAQGYGLAIPQKTAEQLGDAVEQAFELASPIDDWESAAREDNEAVNCHKDPERDEWCCWSIAGDDGDSSMWAASEQQAWREWCDVRCIEPHQREVYEHWIVSDWLADQLIANGEKVDKDCVGLTVWARTCTGQGIASDSVLIKIHADLAASVSALSSKSEG